MREDENIAAQPSQSFEPTANRWPSSLRWQRIAITTILVFVFTVAAVIGDDLLGARAHLLLRPFHNSPLIPSRPLPSPTQSAAPANWNTYTDYGLGFSISYPKEYTIFEDGGGASGIYGIALERQAVDYNEVLVLVGPNRQNIALGDATALYNALFVHTIDNPSRIETITVNGQKAYRTSDCCAGVYEKTVADIVTTSKGNIYEIRVTQPNRRPSDPSNRHVYEAIISSFKLL